MTPIIRKMTTDDLDQVMEIEKASFSVPWSRWDFSESLGKDTTLFLVVELEEKVVGYCGLWCVVDEGEINNVAIRKEYRGQNLGTTLLEAIFAEGLKRNLVAYTLEVRVSNEAAIALYKKLGFIESGVRKNYYSLPKEDALIMWKYLEKQS